MKALKKSKLKTITLNDIRKWYPYYDPSKYAPENWKGTAIDILKAEQIPALDRLWCILRREVIDDKTARLFACWCAREALKLVPKEQISPRSIAAIETAERFAHGKATKKELEAAANAAWAAANAARDAAWDAAWAAADATRDDAWDAARDAARAAARAAAEAVQIKRLIKMLQ